MLTKIVMASTEEQLRALIPAFALVGAGFAALLLFNWLSHRGVELEGPATVISRRPAYGHAMARGYGSSGWNYLVTFRLSDGEEIELSVSRMRFETLKEGDTGILRWQKDQFLYFEPEDAASW